MAVPVRDGVLVVNLHVTKQATHKKNAPIEARFFMPACLEMNEKNTRIPNLGYDGFMTLLYCGRESIKRGPATDLSETIFLEGS